MSNDSESYVTEEVFAKTIDNVVDLIQLKEKQNDAVMMTLAAVLETLITDPEFKATIANLRKKLED